MLLPTEKVVYRFEAVQGCTCTCNVVRGNVQSGAMLKTTLYNLVYKLIQTCLHASCITRATTVYNLVQGVVTAIVDNIHTDLCFLLILDITYLKSKNIPQ